MTLVKHPDPLDQAAFEFDRFDPSVRQGWLNDDSVNTYGELIYSNPAIENVVFFNSFMLGLMKEKGAGTPESLQMVSKVSMSHVPFQFYIHVCPTGDIHAIKRSTQGLV